MRVITGSARGRSLRTLEGMDVRPTTDRVKEGMFSSVQFELEGARVLDLFAGSGQLGIEALSRGARSCTFVDAAKRSCDIVRDNLRTTGLEAAAQVSCMDFASFLSSCGDSFDLVLLDPPYGQKQLPKALALLQDRLSPGGRILCEHSREEELPEEAGSLVRGKVYRYGRTRVTAYTHREGTSEE